MAEEWRLSDEQRADTVARIRTNISSMSFFRGAPQAPEAVATAAAAIEKKAYTVARVEASTTTGMRPHRETLKAYVRKLSALTLEVVANGARADLNGPVVSIGGDSLDLTGDREFLTKESAEEMLAPMLAPGARISRVKFSTKSFGVAAAEVAAAAIRNVAATLVDADMSDVIAGRPEGEALAALRIISEALKTARLRHLNLSDNALGEKGIRAFAPAFAHQEALEGLAIQNVGCSVHGCAALEELLRATHSLKRLHLYNNMSGDEGAAHVAALLARCPAMEDFRMVSSRVGAAGGVALARALASAGTSLLRLDIHDNPMTDEVVGALCHVLRRHPGLVALNLNDTCLGDAGVARVAAALSSCAHGLEELHLALNEVAAGGAGAVAAALAGKRRLRVLNLRENELEDDGALAVAAGVAALTSLRTLDLCTNQIGRGGACAVAKAVAALPALELLALDDNVISEAGVEALREVLAAANKLAALGSLEENMPDEDEEDGGEEEGREEADTDVDALAAELQAEHL